MARRLKQHSTSAEIIRFPAPLYRALVIEPCGNGKWCAIVRSTTRWLGAWRTEAGDWKTVIGWAERFSAQRGLPLLVMEPGKPYGVYPRTMRPRRYVRLGGAA